MNRTAGCGCAPSLSLPHCAREGGGSPARTLSLAGAGEVLGGRARSARRRVAILLLALVLPAAAAAEPRVLVFSKTAGFRHDSIDDGIQRLARLGADAGFAVDASEDAGVFADEGLAPYRAVVFLNTTGDVLDPEQERAFERWVASGGGWVGVHAAADTEYDWPFYGELLGGAWFRSHPAIQPATLEVAVAGAAHPCCDNWPPTFSFTDEWYNFRVLPEPAAVLLRLDESSYDPGQDAMGDDHPLAWQRFVGAGRAFYTGLGHRRETYADEAFGRHLAGGVRWAARIPAGDCDDDHDVDLAEVLLGLEIALAAADSNACPAFDVGRDGGVSVEELVEAVGGMP